MRRYIANYVKKYITVLRRDGGVKYHVRDFKDKEEMDNYIKRHL